MAKKNYIGLEFGELTIIKTYVTNRRRRVDCECSCGNIKENILYQNLRRGRPKDCGVCYNGNYLRACNLSGMSQHSLYNRWGQMKNRCSNQNHPKYKFYGGKGIKVCDDWANDFMKFFQWSKRNGWEQHLELDRIDPDKDYCPGNCQWITKRANLAKRVFKRKKTG